MLQSCIDTAGYSRRLGHKLPTRPTGLSRYSGPLYSMADIQSIVTSPSWTNRRTLFDKTWVQKGDQGQYGSCNGWALAMCASKMRFLQGILDGVVLSGAYLYSKMNGGSDNGSSLADDIDVLTTYGAPSVDVVDNSMIYPKLQPSNADFLAAQHLGLNMTTCETQIEVYSAIAAGFLVVNCLCAGPNYAAFKGGNGNVLPVDRGQADHANHFDDLEMVNGTLLPRNVNNWNTTWGHEGWCYATWNSFAQPIASEPFIAIQGMTEGSTGS